MLRIPDVCLHICTGTRTTNRQYDTWLGGESSSCIEIDIARHGRVDEAMHLRDHRELFVYALVVTPSFGHHL